MTNAAKGLALAAAITVVVATPIQDVQLLDYVVAHRTVNAGYPSIASADQDDTYLGLLDIEPETLGFIEVTRISKGQNLSALHPSIELPDSYWRINFKGRPTVDHFGLWQDLYLVVSERALSVLRQVGVTKAEDDLIDMDVSNYFSSPKKDFWMNRRSS